MPGIVLNTGLDPDTTYQPNEIHLAFGEHNWDGDKRIGNGIVHIFAGHWEDFMRMHPDLNTPESIVKFIFNRIQSQTGVVMADGGTLVCAFRFEGETEVHYLELLIDDGSNNLGPEGRLHSAYPVDGFDPEYEDKYEAYQYYFESEETNNEDLIADGVRI